MKYFRLGDIAPIEQGYVEKAESYWLLNLDKIESNTGKITEYNYVTQNQLKGAIISFDTSNVLYSKLRPYLNKVVVPKMPGYATSELLPLRPNKEIIDKTFLAYFLRSPHFVRHINEKSSGAKMPRAKTKDLLMTKVPCPEIDAQKKIVKKFSRLEKVINCKKEEIQLFDELIKARFVEMFGTFPTNEKKWETGIIKDLVNEVRYGSSRKAAEGNSGKYPYLRMNNITYNGELDLTDTKTIDIPDKELDKCTVRRGDLLFNRTNSKELVGKTCVYNRDEIMVLAGFVVRVRLNKKALPEFVSAFLNTDFSKKMLLNKCKTAIGQANINAQELQSIGIYIPPIEKQKKFVSFKAQVDKSKAVIQKSIDQTQMLFDSLMQEYFS